ncbi:glycosyltransferase family 32 protein [Simonsiella muelleri]|uniref:glycosyltransferase family 32 protein n=1 Tax=Simonsiella muelleri TaxID=72 RepID=UPI0023F4227C|nr:glycosyltransferase [Simonsiella muelleri]
MNKKEKPIEYQIAIFICNRLSRLIGNIVKILSYPFHAIFPNKRFVIPEISHAKIQPKSSSKIPKIIWQTNYSNRVTLPVYCNYLVNRLMSLDCEYRYVSTEARAEFIQQNADEATFQAYSRLTNGASQADFWRVFVLNQLGGIYIDIDAQLVCPVSKIIQSDDNEVIICRNHEVTNYFIAIKPDTDLMKDTLSIIIENIQNNWTEFGVFNMTGPNTLIRAMEGKTVNVRNARYTCMQGTFTNEYFQYIDKKNSKWTHQKPEDLLK